MLSRKDLSSRWNSSISTIKRREKEPDRGFPKPVRLGPRTLRYRLEDIQAYEEKQQTT